MIWFALMPNAPDWILAALLIGTPFLYGGYAISLLRGSMRGRANVAAQRIIAIHWSSALIAAVMVYRDENGFADTTRMLTMAAPLLVLELAVFVGLHWLLWRMVMDVRSKMSPGREA